MSVKVAVRVRPFNAREKERESHCVIDMVNIFFKISKEIQQSSETSLIKKKHSPSIIASGLMMALSQEKTVTPKQKEIDTQISG
jgi:hypothetical protein